MDDSKQCGQGITAAGSIPSALPLKMLKWTGREILDPSFYVKNTPPGQLKHRLKRFRKHFRFREV